MSGRDPLSRPRDLRVPIEGVRVLGLPDFPHDALPLLPRSRDATTGKSHTGRRESATPPSESDGKALGDEELGWFDVTVVDVWGAPVAGVDLELSYQGTKKRVRTSPTGNVRLEGVDASFGSVRFVDIPGVRDRLRPRWLKKRPESSPDVTNPTELALANDMGTASVTSETPMTIVLVKALPRVRLVGMHFDTNKSFMRPLR